MALVFSWTVTHENDVDVADYAKPFITDRIVKVESFDAGNTDIHYLQDGQEPYESQGLYDTASGVAKNAPYKKYRVSTAVATVITNINS